MTEKPSAVNATLAGSGCYPVMGAAPQRILKFPVGRVARPAAVGASRGQIWRGRVRELAGRALSRLGAPGAIADCEFKDAVTGREIQVEVGALCVRLSIDGRDYYFDRFSGRYDGMGSAL